MVDQIVTEKFLADNIVLLTLRAEPKNTLNPEAIVSLTTVFDKYEQMQKIDIICFTGYERAFCTGMNLEAMSLQSEEDAIQTLYLLDILLYKVLRSRKFTIAAINGHAVGSGAVIALATDYRIINSNDKIKVGFPEYPKGITLPGLMREILQRVGLTNARMLLMGDLVSPQRAEQLGLVDEVCDCDVLVRLEEFCATLNNGSFNYRGYKQHFVKQSGFNMPQSDDPEYASVVAMVYALAQRLSP